MRIVVSTILLITVMIIFAGCGGGNNSGGTDQPPPHTDVNSWTVLIYMNADNDLESYAIENLNQMEEVGSTDNVKIVVQVDRHPSYNNSNGNWSNTRRYLITKDTDEYTVHSTLVQNMNEMDMGDPETLRDFVNWGRQNYPADHYCLILWNHGSGWRSPSTKKVLTRDISFDDTSNSSIRITDLPDALSATQAIDLIAFDACMMQMLEVAYKLGNSAHIMVGSEGSPPADMFMINGCPSLLYRREWMRRR